MDKTNKKLLWAEALVKNAAAAQERRATQIQKALTATKGKSVSDKPEDEEDYSLLNAFEMLWSKEASSAQIDAS